MSVDFLAGAFGGACADVCLYPMDTLRARMEECDVRIAEIKKDAYEFKRDIVTGAENFRTGNIVAEKAVRYMEDKLRAKAAVAAKLRLGSEEYSTAEPRRIDRRRASPASS